MPAPVTPPRRRARAVLTVTAALLVCAAVGRWSFFRARHAVAAFAFVRGAVSSLGAPRDGQVVDVRVSAGQRVRKGDVLARLNDLRQVAKREQAAVLLRRAELEVEAERAAIEIERQRTAVATTAARQTASAQAADARAARARAQHAAVTARRAAALSRAEMIAAADRERAAADRAVASAALTSAINKAQGARSQVLRAKVDAAAVDARVARLALLEATVASHRASLAAADAEVELTRIRAPGDGVVSRRFVEPGASVRVGAPLLEVWLDGTLEIEAWLDERDLPWLRIGGPAEVTIPAAADSRAATLIALGVVTDGELRGSAIYVPIAKMLERTRWLRATFRLDVPRAGLVPGLSAEVAVRRPFWRWLVGLATFA